MKVSFVAVNRKIIQKHAGGIIDNFSPIETYQKMIFFKWKRIYVVEVKAFWSLSVYA